MSQTALSVHSAGLRVAKAAGAAPSRALQRRETIVEKAMVTFNEFGEKTTLHGLKYVSDSQSHHLRRIIWAFLLGGSIIGLSFQLRSKFTDFFSSPITIKMRVDYASSLPLPAILFCNTNYFRLSATTEARMHVVVADVFNDSDYHSITNNAYPILREINGPRFVREAAHQLDDMLIYCMWPNGSQCTSKDFKSHLTDYGFCFSINYQKNMSNIATSQSPGIGYGLYLLLNAEDYEAMPGPQRTVGIKVLIYNQTDIPLVSEYGFDLAPGFQTSIGLKYSQTLKLTEKDGGKCGSRPLEFFPDSRVYSRRLCTVDHKYRAALNTCGCLAYNMPLRRNASLRYCTSEQYFSCMTKALQVASNATKREACPETCDEIDYQQYISFAQLSSPKVSALLTETGKRQRMQENFLRAMESKSRYIGSESEDDDELIQALMDIYAKTEENGMAPPRILPSGLFNGTCYESVIEQFVKHSPICVVAEDRQIWDSAGTLEELVDVESEIGNLEIHLNESCASIGLVLGNIDELLSKPRPTHNPDRYITREEILSWVREDQQLTTIRVRLEDARLSVASRVAQFGAVAADVRAHLALVDTLNITIATDIADRAQALLRSAEECLQTEFVGVLAETGSDLSRETLSLVETTLDFACDAYPTCLSSLRAFRAQHDYSWANYSRLWNAEIEQRRSRAERIEAACSDLQPIRDLKFEPSALIVNKHYREVVSLIDKFQSRSITKAKFAQEMIKLKRLPSFPQNVEVHFAEMVQRIKREDAALAQLQKGVGRIFCHLSDPQIAELYIRLFSGYSGVEGLAGEMRSVNACAAALAPRLDTEARVAAQLSEGYIEAYDALLGSLVAYNDSLRIEELFFRKNLLAVSIYIREMSIEVLQQVPAYNFFSLLCDVGGTLGLFLGASFMTLAEVVEYVMLQLVRWVKQRRKERRAGGEGKGSGIVPVASPRPPPSPLPSLAFSSLYAKEDDDMPDVRF